MDREPITKTATVVSIVGAVIALLVAFGVSFTEEQTTAIMGVVVVLSPFVVAFIARQWTVPMDSDGYIRLRGMSDEDTQS